MTFFVLSFSIQEHDISLILFYGIFEGNNFPYISLIYYIKFMHSYFYFQSINGIFHYSYTQ